jgi:hypothetical protein
MSNQPPEHPEQPAMFLPVSKDELLGHGQTGTGKKDGPEDHLPDHKFGLKQLEFGKVNKQPFLKLSFFFNKLPDVSYEHFHRWWSAVHADLTVTAQGFGVHIKRYEQV